jgi:hypothetical protein
MTYDVTHQAIKRLLRTTKSLALEMAMPGTMPPLVFAYFGEFPGTSDPASLLACRLLAVREQRLTFSGCQNPKTNILSLLAYILLSNLPASFIKSIVARTTTLLGLELVIGPSCPFVE